MRVATILATLVLFFAVSASGLQGAIFPSDLAAYWELDGDLTDSAGSNDGSFVDVGAGAPGFAAGFDGTASGALDFAGTSDYVSTTLTPATGPKSLSLFFSTNSTAFQIPAGSHGSQRFYVGAHATVAGNVVLGVGAGGAGTQPLPSVDFTPTGTDVSTDDTYHHLVLVDDGAGNSILYYRSPSDPGHLVYSDPYTGTSGGAGTFSIGELDNGIGLPASGRVDDVAVFNRELTVAEVQSIYSLGSVRAYYSRFGPFSNGLVGYWPFDGNANDLSGASHDGSLQGDAHASGPGKFGGAAALDGTGDFVRVADHSDFDPGTESFSFAGWIKTSVGESYLLQKLGNDAYWNADGYGIRVYEGNTTQVRGGMQDHEGTFSTTFDNYGLAYNLADGQWHHVAMVVDRDLNLQSYYIDGNLVDVPKDIAYFAARAVGNDGTLDLGLKVNGMFDDVAFWNRVLSGGEIAFLASQPLTNFIPEPSSLVLLAMGLLGMGLAVGRRRRR